jgi:integrase
MARKTAGKRTTTAGGSVRVHGKASNGEGSLYRDADGAWRATYTVAGEARPRRVRGKTREEALARRAVKLEELSQTISGTFDRDTTVAELAAWWLDTVARHRVRPSTLGKYASRVARIATTLGDMPVRTVKAEHVARWQSELLKGGLASGTVGDLRVALHMVLEQGVIHELIAANPVDRVAAPKVVRSAKRALSSTEARALIGAASSDRLGAAVALLFVQGWRVSEVLGLAWEDLDLDAGVAIVRRAAVYVDTVGMVLGPTKNAGAAGTHHLSAGVVEALRARRKAQAAERLAVGSGWPAFTYERQKLSLVFTNLDGSLVNRQAVAKAVTKAAERAGLDTDGLATHTGRRTAVTVLYAEAGLDLSDIARYVGHAGEATTAGYVRSLGERPKATAAVAASMLDPVRPPHRDGQATVEGER